MSGVPSETRQAYVVTLFSLVSSVTLVPKGILENLPIHTCLWDWNQGLDRIH